MQTPDLKHCPICTKDLPVSEFGICRARKDGRNLYCMSCIREKVAASRRSLKKYKQARKKYAPAPVEPMFGFPVKVRREQTPTDRVLEAIGLGFKTQEEIRKETRLSSEVIGDAIANLLLWTREIKTVLVDDQRIYLPNVMEEKPQIIYPQALSLVEIARKGLGPVMKGMKSMRRVA